MKSTDFFRILLVSPEPWDHVFVSKHHYASSLAGLGHMVFFLNPSSKHTYSVHPSGQNNLSVVEYCKFPSGMRFFPKFIRCWFLRDRIREIQSICGGNFDMIYSFDPSVFYDFNCLPSNIRVKVLHLVDYNQNFQVQRAASSASICFGSSQHLIRRLTRYNSKSFYLNHGLNIARSDNPIALSAREGFAVGYAGNLDNKYVDWRLIEEMLRGHPSITFYFAGSLNNESKRKTLLQFSNVILLGKLESNQLQSFFSKMDALILVYQADDWPEQLANPHKMLEYLYSGKPVISTYTSQYADIEKNLIYMSKKNSEWLGVFRRTVDNLSCFSKNEYAQERRDFALEHTYGNQIEKIFMLINSHLW